MDFSAKSKKTLKALTDYLEIEVEAKKKNKPTMDELVAACEAYEQENGEEAIKEAYEALGFDEETEDETEEDLEDEAPKGKGVEFTYVGKGETSPQRINFMGRQEFVRGRPVLVTDSDLIKKLNGNPTFIKGKANPELLQSIEDEGIAQAEANRKMDKKMDATFKKQHGGGPKED